MDKFFRVEIFKVQKEANSNVIHMEKQQDEYISEVEYNTIITLPSFKEIDNGLYYSEKDGYTFRFVPITEEEYKTNKKIEIENQK